MASLERHFFEFDDFRLDVEERRLEHAGANISLTPRTFDILLALVANAGSTVDKHELMATVWPDTFVEEGNLNRHVSTLRRALGDDPREQRLIKTIPKHGYRFTAKVIERVESNVSVDTISRGHLVIKQETIEGFWSGRRIAFAAVMFAGLVATTVWLSFDRSADARPAIEARTQYERGRDLWRTRSPADLYQATLLLEGSVRTDPSFALAHSALADAYAFDYSNWKKAEAEATKAIELDPALGEPHATIGFIRMFWEWRLADAEAEFKTAIKLSPNYATGHQWYALNLAAEGRGDAAVVEIEKALMLEPQSNAINNDYCQILYFVDKFDSAAGQCLQVLSRDPGNQATHELLYQIFISAGRENEAVEKFIEALSLSKSELVRNQAERFRRAYADGGMREFRRTQIDLYRHVAPSSYKLARVLAEMGDQNAAVDVLKEGIRSHDFDMVFMNADPAFKSLRNGPQPVDIQGFPIQ